VVIFLCAFVQFRLLHSKLNRDSDLHGVGELSSEKAYAAGCISEFWHGTHLAVFVLRRAQHERPIVTAFPPSPVRPEHVEG
jgi:hypothetical protein